jgi:hypothetical protein
VGRGKLAGELGLLYGRREVRRLVEALHQPAIAPPRLLQPPVPEPLLSARPAPPPAAAAAREHGDAAAGSVCRLGVVVGGALLLARREYLVLLLRKAKPLVLGPLRVPAHEVLVFPPPAAVPKDVTAVVTRHATHVLSVEVDAQPPAL